MKVGREPAQGTEPLPCVSGVLHVVAVQQDELLLHSQGDSLHLFHYLRGEGGGRGGWGEGRMGREMGEGWVGRRERRGKRSE